MDSRSFVSLAVGITGIVLGVFAGLDGSVAGVIAGVAALGAGLIGWMVARQLLDTERQLAVERRQLDSMEQTITAQVQARVTAEESIRNLSTELASTQRSEAERLERVEDQIRDEIRVQTDSKPAGNSVNDVETGLFNEHYFRATTEARVAAARRHLRPVAIILMQVSEKGSDDDDELTPASPKIVADYLAATLRESDTACRTSRGLYALVLEDTPENGAVWTVERIRRRLAEEQDNLMMWAGVACYPAHAFEVRDLVAKASEALEAATDWNQDRIEVATSDT
jgi:diguanylate cyclase (GGDEF)-like protein